MESKSRTEYSARNTTATVTSRLLAIVMGYALRVVFTHMLTESYVGINGLFLDIVNVLSLSEMGVGTAITFALYRPIADGDVEKQKSLMRMFGNFYRLVAAIVVVLGLALLPFMDILIKDYEDVDQITYIYLLYLANTALSYLFIYKKILMDAHQLLYIGIFYQTLSWIIQDVLQMIVLLWRQDFILYLWINIATTLLCNVAISRRANKLYPYLKDREVESLPKDERQDIFKNIKAMLMHKVGNVIVNNTDNLILSAFVGLISVGSYSNYYLVIGSIRQLLNQVYQGITASVGNLNATEKEGHVHEVFEVIFFAGQWLYGFATICLYELLNPFVEFSFGKQYLFSNGIVLILCINFFLRGMRYAVLTFRDSMGLFWYDRYITIIEAILNIVFSLIFVQTMGVIGVFLGTTLSMLLTSVWVEPTILYKKGFHESSAQYFVKYSIYFIALCFIWLLTDQLCLLVTGNVLLIFAVRLLICLVVPNVFFLLIYHRTKEFRYLLEKVQSLRKR